MEKSIDSMGRIVIPSEFRKQLRISEGDKLDLQLEGSTIKITKSEGKSFDIRREKEFYINHDNIERIKAKYPEGTLVECIEMKDEGYSVPRGVRGVVFLVDDLGSIHVNWENGSTLALLEDVDRFKVIK